MAPYHKITRVPGNEPTPATCRYGLNRAVAFVLLALGLFGISAIGALIPGGGFEQPVLSGTQFEYRPAGGPWAFTGGAGISRNGSGFTSGNPNAPEGAQVLLLQGVSSRADQSVVFGPGTFRVEMWAAQRGNVNNGGQTFRVLVDGVELERFTPVGTTYGELATGVFNATAGTHTIRLEGLNPLGGDNTVFVDAIQVVEVQISPSGANASNATLRDLDLTLEAVPGAPGPRLTWRSSPFATYLLSRSFDLQTWTNLNTLTAAGESTTVWDQWIPGKPEAFYRVGHPVPSFLPPVTAVAHYSRPPAAVVGGGFEDSSIVDFAYRPAFAGWVMTGGAGIAADGGSFTSDNPPAVEGSRVAFLQGTAAMETMLDSPQSGTHRLRFHTAQRNRGATLDRQVFRVFIAGVEVLEMEPAKADYEEVFTRPFRLAAGSHTLRIESFNPHGGDNTCFVDLIRVEPVREWQDPLTWHAGVVPSELDDVFIPAGAAVALSGNCQAATLRVEGGLLVAPVNTTFRTRWLVLTGARAVFQVGRHTTPFVQEFILTLTGQSTNENIMGAGSKGLAAMNGALVDLHGTPQVSWTKLNATANAGASLITLAQPVNWRIGDQIVIAPSGLNPDEAEVRTIAGRPSSTTLQLNAGLTYRHFGGAPQTYTRSADNKSWTLDQRAEVGLLTHNVKVQGDGPSDATGFGGHIMVMNCAMCVHGGFSRLSNVELFRMGQKSRLARYPMHWHMQGTNGAGQFIEDSSIHRSFNRAVTIHGTDSARVERNVAYDHLGHGLFLEDGSERFNKVNYNLALLTKRPAPGEEVLPSDNSDDEDQNRTPATYWITNPNNEFIGNVAAGTVGTGFWFIYPQTPTGLSANDPRFAGLQPFRDPLGTFRSNVAHSCKSALDINDQVNPDHTIRKNGEWGLDGPFYFDDFTMYANRTGLYAGIGGERTNVIYRNNVFADNQQHIFFATYHLVADSLLVADSGNNLISNSLSRTAFLLYDGAGRMEDCHLVGFNSSNASLLQTIGAAFKHPNTLFTRLTFNHAGTPRSVLPDADFTPPDYGMVNSQADPRLWGSVIVDVNGSVGGQAGRRIVGNHPMMLTGGEIQPTNWTRTYFTTNQFAHLRLRYSLAAAQIPDVTFTREKAGTATRSYFYGFKVDPHHQIPVIVNADFAYTAEFASLPGTRLIEIHFDDAVPGDNLLLRLKAISNLPRLLVSGMTLRNSLSELQSAPNHSYFKDANGDLWLKFVATGKVSTATIYW